MSLKAEGATGIMGKDKEGHGDGTERLTNGPRALHHGAPVFPGS